MSVLFIFAENASLETDEIFHFFLITLHFSYFNNFFQLKNEVGALNLHENIYFL